MGYGETYLGSDLREIINGDGLGNCQHHFARKQLLLQ